MFYAIISVIAIAIILFIMSFFMNDRMEDVENQVERLSISTMQDTYHIKNRLKAVEDKVFTSDASDGLPDDD